VCHWNYYTIANSNLLQIFISAGCLRSSLLRHYHFFINNSVCGARRRLSSSVSSAIRFLFLDLTCFIVENVLSHTSYTFVFPNIECMFSAKSFSLRNLCLLTNFQKLSAVSNAVRSVHSYLKDYSCCNQNYIPIAGIGNWFDSRATLRGALFSG